MYLLLVSEIERQLRDAYDRKYRQGLATQSSLAEKIGINRSAVHRRLMGHTNMTIETLADMVWALDQCISVNICDPAEMLGNHFIGVRSSAAQPREASLALSTGSALTDLAADLLQNPKSAPAQLIRQPS
jgi:hypothetical protein